MRMWKVCTNLEACVYLVSMRMWVTGAATVCLCLLLLASTSPHLVDVVVMKVISHTHMACVWTIMYGLLMWKWSNSVILSHDKFLGIIYKRNEIQLLLWLCCLFGYLFRRYWKRKDLKYIWNWCQPTYYHCHANINVSIKQLTISTSTLVLYFLHILKTICGIMCC